MISSGYGITEGLGLFLSQQDSRRTMHSAVCGVGAQSEGTGWNSQGVDLRPS